MPDPLYQRIADDLRRKIESGALKPGAKLPPEPELSELYGVGRNTVRRAMHMLTKRGLVQTWRGQGTFVVVKPRPFIITLSPDSATGLGGGEGQAYQAEARAQGKSPLATDLRVEINIASGPISEELQLAEGAAVVSRHQERLTDGKPYSLQASHYPMSLVDAGASRLTRAVPIEPGTVKYLRDVLGLRQARYRDKISVRSPTEAEAAFFRLEDSDLVSVFEQRRTAFDAQGRPFRLTVSVFPADRNQFVVFVGQVPPEARKLTSGPPAETDEAVNA